MKKSANYHVYMGVIIERCGINSSGMRWYALGNNGYLKADTLSGIKELIKNERNTK